MKLYGYTNGEGYQKYLNIALRNLWIPPIFFSLLLDIKFNKKKEINLIEDKIVWKKLNLKFATLRRLKVADNLIFYFFY